MKLRCWPGCMAIVTRSTNGNNGAIVHVLSYGGLDCGRPTWKVTANRLMNTDIGTRTSVGRCVDAILTPITPPPNVLEEHKHMLADLAIQQ